MFIYFKKLQPLKPPAALLYIMLQNFYKLYCKGCDLLLT